MGLRVCVNVSGCVWPMTVVMMMGMAGVASAGSRVTVLPGEDSMPRHGRCETITIPVCINLPYNQTIMPNLLNHAKQDEAAKEIHQLVPLIKVKCSPDLHFFLCTLYAPICTIMDEPLPPCRELCQSARNRCEGTMNTYGYPWPENLDCSKFPPAGEQLCVDNKTGEAEGRTSRPPVLFEDGVGGPRNPGLLGSAVPGGRDLGFVCPLQLTVPKGFEYKLRVGDKIEPNCGAPCDSMFFTERQREFARAWVGSWGGVCAVSCLMTVLTFLIDPERFRYPERPIIFLSGCYLLVAAAYAAGWASGDSVSCREAFPPPAHLDRLKMVPTISQGTKHERCTIVFMVLYFFSMASSIWWVVLTLTWFLAAGLKWGHEAIEANSQYFHLAAWAVPAIKTICILAMGKVDGNTLTLLLFMYYVFVQLFFCLISKHLYILFERHCLISMRNAKSTTDPSEVVLLFRCTSIHMSI